MSSRDRFVVYLALGSALFAFIVAELLPMGLMPQIAADLGVSPSRVGLLISVYALSAAVLGLPVVWACRKLPGRTVLSGCLLWLAAGQIALACAPSLSVALAARIAVAGAHVAVWGIAPLAAADIEGPGRQGRATGRVLLGGTLGTLLGIPGITLLGQHLGWRAACWVVAILAAATACVLRRFLPVQDPEEKRPDTSRHGGVKGPIAWILAATVLGIAGLQAYYPYLSEYTAASHLRGPGFAAVLVGVGVAGALGVHLASRTIDPHPRATVVAVFTLGATAPLMFPHPWPSAVFAALAVGWGVSVAAAPVVLQTTAIKAAGPRAELASAAYVVSFQIGIALGAWAGGHGGPLLSAGAQIAGMVAMAILLTVRTTTAPVPTPATGAGPPRDER